MKSSLPRHLLFDLDGTILDSLPGIQFSVDCALEAIGLPRAEINLKRLLGPPIRVIFSRIVPTGDATLLDRLEQAFRASYDAEGWEKATCYMGAREFLEGACSAGHCLYVVSNKPRLVSLRILEREDLLPFFEQVYTRDSRYPAYASKEEMLTKVLKDMGVLPSECLMIGDTMEDVTAAEASEIPMALMEHGYGEVDSEIDVAMRLRDFSDFKRLLDVERTQ